MKFGSEIFDYITPKGIWKQEWLEALEKMLNNKLSFSGIPKGFTKKDLIKELALVIYENSPLNIEKNIS